MAKTIEVTTKLFVENCCACGIAFAMPEDFEERSRKDHQSFYCPSGHSQSYPAKSEEERLREELKREQARRDREVGELRNANLVLKNEKLELEKQQRRVMRRVHKGICPHCNRTFENLARHMTTKHAKVGE